MEFDPALVALYSQYAGLGLVSAGAVYPLSLDTENPLTPTCAMTAETCATPLRLGQGIPYSYTRKLMEKIRGVTLTSELI